MTAIADALERPNVLGPSARADTPQFIRGVPHPLPVGEQLLWEGAPSSKQLARHVFHWRLVAAYFAAMLVLWWTTTTLTPSSDLFLPAVVVRVTLSAFVVAIAIALAQVVARTTWYAITSQRVVLRIGMVFPMSINIPFSAIEAVGVGQFRDGSGQVRLTLAKASRLAYIALWPHCEVFRFAQPQPVLRGLDDPQRIARILAEAAAAASPREG